ncbi:MAG: hypothetical protein MUF02_01160 [Acidobacteria bacterium]|nr:hypothetical protein [Acidobacteriota bacterium]
MKRPLLALLAAAWTLGLPAKELLEIRGDYLLYSYDHNHIFGQGGIQLKSREWTIRAGRVEVDMAGRRALVSGDCRVEAGQRAVEADTLTIDLETLDLRLMTFAENIGAWTLPGKRPGAPAAGGASAPSASPVAGKRFAAWDLEALKKSLVYFLSQRIVISTRYGVYGYQTTAFIEGVQSLSFKKLNLDRGMDTSRLQGAWLDRLWFYASQGLVLNSHFLLEKPLANGTARSANVLDVKYDLFQQIESGSALRVDFSSLNSLSLTRNHEANLGFSFLTDNLFQARLALKSQWTPGWSSEVAAEFRRTAARREELWLHLGSQLQQKILGAVSLDLGYEKEKQYRGTLSLRNQALKNVAFSLQHSFSRLLFGEGAYARQSQSNVSLAYTHRLFQLAADYSFHRDLLQNQSQGTPRVTLNATPFRLYHGLLRVNFASSFSLNQLTLAGRRDDQSQANIALSLQNETIRLGRGPALTFSMAAEQFLEPERSNQYTSLGCVLRCTQSLSTFADLDFLYNYNTRRRTEAWLIQGTTSQDWSTVLRLKDRGQRVQGWASVSFDSKMGRFTSSYLDCAVSLGKNWQFQTQMNYDFPFRNFHYDVCLVRHAGRIMLRASYRSLSRQVLVEVLPR